jgi:hypothetical protein
MTYNQQVAYEDPGITGLPMLGGTATAGSIASCTLSAIPGPSRVFVATFTINYASVSATAFTTSHGIMAGDIIILKCADVTHAWLMGANGTKDTVY